MTYTVNMPQTSQLISVTQPLIEANFNALDTFLKVDHVALNAVNQGTHQAIHLTQQGGAYPGSDPVTLSTELGLYSRMDVGNILRLWLREPSSGTIRQLSGNVVIGGVLGPPPTFAGETMILGGIKIKWGNVAVTNSLTTTVTFPIAFPTSCFGVLAFINATGAPTNSILTGTYPTASGFGLRCNSATNNLNAFWVAIGN